MTLYDIMFFKQRKEKLEIRIAIEMTEAYDSFAAHQTGLLGKLDQHVDMTVHGICTLCDTPIIYEKF
eukprot:gene982-4226_t